MKEVILFAVFFLLMLGIAYAGTVCQSLFHFLIVLSVIQLFADSRNTSFDI